ncbi:GNAT family N-acetyltransferase [Rhodovulum euryhalinum]|uniref:Ribosomal protein S18 acetylase RimI-like enzyme n=1 Tax=Rhodovulum euryhalinum TaxID=35805 RepID=A0A4R2K9Q5_9RHOB|nr:GNAT family N-acetyltransferase [Rhodovulum euryhalinum]TCO70143.1 ribosomal protein S18 acetylase RimI-like enzyme [Rhodovulum euryhalinum]
MAERKTQPDTAEVAIGPVEESDLSWIVALDTQNTGMPKPDYWRRLLDGARTEPHRSFFLVARSQGTRLGFIAGEIRAWEFGSAPCGWIFAIGVEPDWRLRAVGTQLFDAICAGFRQAGVTKVRTMIAREAQLIMSFFRAHGMMAGPFVELEKDLDE